MNEKEVKRYKVLSAEHAIYTDPETGKIISENVVVLSYGIYRTFRYPECGPRCYLLKEGDTIQIEGNPAEGKVL